VNTAHAKISSHVDQLLATQIHLGDKKGYVTLNIQQSQVSVYAVGWGVQCVRVPSR
jgi:hypothetical protein